MRLLESLLKTLLILLSILSFTTAVPFSSPRTTETETEIELHPPNAVHLATSFISLSHALSSLRLTKCPLDVVSINQTTSKRSAGIPKRGHEEAAAAAPHLSPPSAHLSLKFIALGRGTQNYTCPTTSKDNTPKNSSATPIATGAVATLYDISCLAATPKDHALRFLHALPGFTRAIPQEVLAFYAVMLSQSAIIGEHYFSPSQSSSTTSTTAAAAMPVFDLRPATFGKQGGRYESNWVKAKKVESVNAPGSGGDDVPWLKMVSVEGSGIQEIYRVHTAGGMSPATCAAHEGEFGVEYAAEYWFYG
ncbi:DUF3455 domain-containing protein [Aspergillus fijiensis CBS 313.89]|uniref:Malate dehydrogenase n=1 Tax=Aspergillus fijiensis CBS 313.89 TaxID=1448319 RepID=A0A8G1VYS8_9EURO|nr:uncharacterized protein BO72DRAFT_495871 [Aspergillus fijiensis CBS 313.89]RAK77567.1 hypothetical protein BO72DRAFT_495871 [Aspergillus fijiensis CBS 313.89]